MEPQSQPQQSKDPLGDYWKQLSTGQKFLTAIGSLCFLATAILTITNLGFTSDPNTTYDAGFMSDTTMWAVHISLGMLGGLCLAPRKMVSAVLAGGITGAAITGITILYTSWRETLYSIEIVIPILLAVLIGWKVFALLGGKPKKIVDEDYFIDG